MKYLVVATASIERGNAVDDKGGPAPIFKYIVERFKPEALYGNPTRRQAIMIVDLPTEADIAELMYVFTRINGTEPEFTPLLSAEVFDQALERARQAPTL